MRTVHAIGLDGVPPRLVDEGIERGRLPTLERLRSEGVDGTTRSTVPPVSMMAWSTFATGMNPGNHGIFNFMLKEEGGYDTSFVDATTLRSNAVSVWEYLDAHGVASGVMNVMPGYPVSNSRGFHISDYITTPEGGQFAEPRSLQDSVEENYDFEIGPPTGFVAGDGPEALESYLEEFFATERERLELAKYLVTEHDCPAMLLVFSGPDIFLHEVGYLLDPDHPKYDEAEADAFGDAHLDMLEMYDGFLGWLRDRMATSDLLLVLSDHGHGPVYTSVNLNSWLYRNGYLELERSPSTWLKRIWFDHGFETFERLLKRLRLYDRLKEGLARTSNGEDGPDLASALTFSTADIDWTNTTAFSVAGDGQVYLNTDHHRAGIVRDAEYESVREELRRELAGIEHPERDGPVIDTVHDGEDIYADEYATTRPDLVCVPSSTYRITFPQTMNTRSPFGAPAKWASHTSREDQTGIFLAAGDGVESSSSIEMKLEDFAPTILSVLGLPVPERMDGAARTDSLGLDIEPVRRSQVGVVETRRAVRSVAERIRSRSDGFP